ncbi:MULTISPECIES: hypothetical protein [Sphingomonas]|nr:MULTISPECIES: hypothetical protein [Sphingomonas]
MTGNTMKARIARIEAVRPNSADRITRIVRTVINPDGTPTGEVIVRAVP